MYFKYSMPAVVKRKAMPMRWDFIDNKHAPEESAGLSSLGMTAMEAPPRYDNSMIYAVDVARHSWREKGINAKVD